LAADSTLEALFWPITWNSEVAIVSEAVIAASGITAGAVVGLTHITDENMAHALGVPILSRLLEVEGPEGNTVTVRLEDVKLIE
jgi:hypothetical protein